MRNEENSVAITTLHYDLVTSELKPVTAAAKRILTICRKEFLRGESNAKKRSTPLGARET